VIDQAWSKPLIHAGDVPPAVISLLRNKLDALSEIIPKQSAFRLFMVCQQLDQLERDLIEASAESPEINTSEWTDREFSCLLVILDHKRHGHQGERCAGD
jgi:hypothetical protein